MRFLFLMSTIHIFDQIFFSTGRLKVLVLKEIIVAQHYAYCKYSQEGARIKEM